MESGRPPDARAALATLWRVLGGDACALDAVALDGAEPVLPSSFAVGTAAQVSIAAAALAARQFGVLRGGPAQRITVPLRDAAIEFRSERYLRVDGRPAADPWDRIAGLYRCGDGGWVRLHTNFPHHRDGVLRLLGCAHERAAVQQALQRWRAEAFEAACADAGLVVAALRSFEQWDDHPQGRAVAARPVLTIARLDDAPAEPLPPLPVDERPLAGVRVLDLTRIIAGPVAGRALAAYGADVLHVSAAHLPAIDALVIDTGRGKRSARVDLRQASERETLRTLVRGADVWLQAYRPGALAAFGFAPEDLARERPGLVCASLSAYGCSGPWSARRGFDSLVQTATGFNAAEARAAGADEPKPLPAQVLDHGTGYLLAAGVAQALARRAREGGSWHVEASLAQTGHWLRGLGRVRDGLRAPEPDADEVAARLERSASGFGVLDAVRHAARFDATPAGWTRPSVPLGHDAARW